MRFLPFTDRALFVCWQSVVKLMQGLLQCMMRQVRYTLGLSIGLLGKQNKQLDGVALYCEIIDVAD